MNSQCSGPIDQSITGQRIQWSWGFEGQGVKESGDGAGTHGRGGRGEQQQLLEPADENEEGMRNTKTNRVKREEQIQSGGGKKNSGRQRNRKFERSKEKRTSELLSDTMINLLNDQTGFQ